MVWGRKNRAVPPGLTGCGQPSKNLPLPSSVIMPNLVKHRFPKISDPWHLASRVRGVGDPVKSCPRQVWSLSKIFSLSMPHTLESLSTLKTCSYPRWVAMPNLVMLGQSICAYVEECSNSLDPWDQTFKGHSRSPEATQFYRINVTSFPLVIHRVCTGYPVPFSRHWLRIAIIFFLIWVDVVTVGILLGHFNSENYQVVNEIDKCSRSNIIYQHAVIQTQRMAISNL